MLINHTHIVQHDVVFVVFLPVVFVSLPQVSTCLQEHILVQCLIKMNIFTVPKKKASIFYTSSSSHRRQRPWQRQSWSR